MSNQEPSLNTSLSGEIVFHAGEILNGRVATQELIVLLGRCARQLENDAAEKAALRRQIDSLRRGDK